MVILFAERCVLPHLSYTAYMQSVSIASAAAVAVYTAVAMFFDLRAGRLPNWLTVPAFALALLFHAVCGLGLNGFGGLLGGVGFSLGGFAVGFTVLFVLWNLGAGLAGDVKFMGALGAWLGAWMTFQVLVVGAVFAGVLTIGIEIVSVLGLNPWRKKQSSGSVRRKRAMRNRSGSPTPLHRFGRAGAVPFALPAALAAWFLLLMQWLGYTLPWPPPI
jgi:prepilin peptidase CpaA